MSGMAQEIRSDINVLEVRLDVTLACFLGIESEIHAN